MRESADDLEDYAADLRVEADKIEREGAGAPDVPAPAEHAQPSPPPATPPEGGLPPTGEGTVPSDPDAPSSAAVAPPSGDQPA